MTATAVYPVITRRRRDTYNVTLDGTRIVTDAKYPELAACRYLERVGHIGPIQFKTAPNGPVALTVKSPRAGMDLMAWEDGRTTFVAGSAISQAR